MPTKTRGPANRELPARRKRASNLDFISAFLQFRSELAASLARLALLKCKSRAKPQVFQNQWLRRPDGALDLHLWWWISASYHWSLPANSKSRGLPALAIVP